MSQPGPPLLCNRIALSWPESLESDLSIHKSRTHLRKRPGRCIKVLMRGTTDVTPVTSAEQMARPGTPNAHWHARSPGQDIAHICYFMVMKIEDVF